jgi:hypothetical protein
VVEHSCQRCGSAVDDNLPFCPNCEAPQIRFSPGEVALKSIVVGPVGDAFAPVYSREMEPASYEAPSRFSFNWRGALRPALTAGVIAAVLSLLPLISLIALPIGGFLSVVFFRRTSARKLSSKMGFGLGALCGVFCSVILALIKTARVFLSHSENEIRNDLVQQVHLAQARNSDPQLTQVWGYLQTTQGLLLMMIFGVIFTGVIFVLLSGIGGAVSAAVLRRKDADQHR